MLKYHAHFCANLLDIFDVVGHLYAVHDDPASLMLLEAIDAADQGRFSGARGAADDDTFLFMYGKIDASKNMKIAEPLVNVDKINHGIVRRSSLSIL